MSLVVKEAKTDEELLACWPAVQALRTHVLEKDYLPRIKQQIAEENFHLMYIEDPDTKRPGSILGYRTFNKLFSGKTLYVDDLSTLPESRGKGHAGALLDWARKYAEENDFDQVTLDSGCNPLRYNAHRLYLNKGYNITCHHFVIDLRANPKK